MAENENDVWRPKSEIGKEIRAIRNRLSLSQEKLAAAIGAPGSQAQVSLWERGEVRPEPETMAKIARLAGLGIDVFQRGGPPPDVERAGLLVAADELEKLATSLRERAAFTPTDGDDDDPGKARAKASRAKRQARQRGRTGTEDD